MKRGLSPSARNFWRPLPVDSLDAMNEAIREHRGGKSNPFQTALACYQFAYEMEVGDIVFAKKGTKKILGYGSSRLNIVTSPARKNDPSSVRRLEVARRVVDFEIEHSDDGDKEIARDSQPGGRLERVLGRVHKDIAQGRTKPLSEQPSSSLLALQESR